MADIQYKIEYEKSDGSHLIRWYDDKSSAVRYYNKLKNEKYIVTKWAEIWSTDWEVANDDWHLEEGFEREVIYIMGIPVVSDRQIEY